MIGKQFRKVFRVIRFAWVLGSAGMIYVTTVWLAGKSSQIPARAAWMRDTSRRLLAAMNIVVTRQGSLPANGLLAANHLGYIDIVVLGAAQPTIFLSKSEVRQWPVLGLLTACAGTLFIRRDRKTDVARFDEPFAQVVNAGLLLGIFPEGTSTDGHQVLAFHSSLFAAAAAAQWPVTPVWIGYQTDDGSVEQEVCYWGDMTFFSHFWQLAGLKQVRATVVYGRTLIGEPDRKQLARRLHREVCQLFEEHRRDLKEAEASSAKARSTANPSETGAAAPAGRHS